MCKICRKICDRKSYQDKKRKLNESTSESAVEKSTNESASAIRNDPENESPACFVINDANTKWVKRSHVDDCRLVTLSAAKAKTRLNLAVIHKSQFGGTSKDVYDSYRMTLREDEDVTAEDMVDAFPPFAKVKSTFDKACKFIRLLWKKESLSYVLFFFS